MKKQPEKLNELIALLRKTKEQEIDCDEFWEKGPSLAESSSALSEDDLKLYLRHLELCSGCHENFNILKSIVQEQNEA